MKGVLIDPFEKTVSFVDVERGIDSIYSMIGQDCFDAVRYDDVNVMYVDDEGLFRVPQRYFKLDFYSQPLGGKALILGVDGEGDSCSATPTVSEIYSHLEWVRPDLYYSHSEESSGTMDHPIFGKTNFIRREAIFKDSDGNEYR